MGSAEDFDQPKRASEVFIILALSFGDSEPRQCSTNHEDQQALISSTRPSFRHAFVLSLNGPGHPCDWKHGAPDPMDPMPAEGCSHDLDLDIFRHSLSSWVVYELWGHPGSCLSTGPILVPKPSPFLQARTRLRQRRKRLVQGFFRVAVTG